MDKVLKRGKFLSISFVVIYFISTMIYGFLKKSGIDNFDYLGMLIKGCLYEIWIILFYFYKNKELKRNAKFIISESIHALIYLSFTFNFDYIYFYLVPFLIIPCLLDIHFDWFFPDAYMIVFLGLSLYKWVSFLFFDLALVSSVILPGKFLFLIYFKIKNLIKKRRKTNDG